MMRIDLRRMTIVYLLLTTTTLIGCASHTAITTDKLEPYECGTVTRLHTFGGIFLASQPKPDDFRQAQKGGIKTVINLRLPGEVTDFDEPALIAELGMTYYNVPFNGPDMLTDEVIDNTRALLNNDQIKPLLLHCSSANRVGAIWLAYRAIDHGLPYNQALAEAKTVGLKSPTYEQIVKRYIGRHQ